jgi:hypothetical protein
VGLTPGQKVIGKLLHATHLDVVGKAVAGMSKAVIDVDGERFEEPLYEAHFVPCAPGGHDVAMFMQGRGPASDAASKSVYGATFTVSVQEGMVTVLLYTPRDGMGATLTLVGYRDGS